MVGLDGVGGDDEEDGADDQEVEDDSPPSQRREVVISDRPLSPRSDGCDEREKPSGLREWLVSMVQIRVDRVLERRTMAIEMVAKAKGSPSTLPTWMPLRPYWPRECSIFRSDGECREPYDGIRKSAASTRAMY